MCVFMKEAGLFANEGSDDDVIVCGARLRKIYIQAIHCSVTYQRKNTKYGDV